MTLLPTRNLILILLALGLSSCESFSFFAEPFGEPIPEQAKPETQMELARTETIYVQDLSGENVMEVKKLLFDAFEKEGMFQVVDILPEELEGVSVMRLRVIDHALWETLEKSPEPKKPKPRIRLPFAVPSPSALSSKPESEMTEEELKEAKKKQKQKKGPEGILRRNALVTVAFELYNGINGRVIVNETFSQPFQQIYVGDETIAKRPRKEEELKRLTSNLVARILTTLDPSKQGREGLELERGESSDWFSEEVHDMGDMRIAKANRFAEAGDYEQAAMMWRLTIYEPYADKSQNFNLTNRATSFYNLGRMYYVQRDYLNAARMFSQANRLVQKLKYAENWSRAMQAWLRQSEEGLLDEEEEFRIVPIKIKKRKKKVDLIKQAEENPVLLLDPKKLWPLNPVIVNRKDEELNGQMEVEVAPPDADDYQEPPANLPLSPQELPSEPMPDSLGGADMGRMGHDIGANADGINADHGQDKNETGSETESLIQPVLP